MKTYRTSRTMFMLAMTVDLLLLCPTFGIWIIFMIRHILTYMNQSLIIGQQGLVLKTGILRVQTHDIRYSKINSITVSKGMMGRMFGYGTITIFTGNDVSGIKFKNVDNPDQIKREIDSKS